MDARTSSKDDATTKKSPPYKMYGGIVASIVAVRFLDIATQRAAWTSAIYSSTGWWIALGLFAVVAAIVAAPRLQKRVPPIMVLLLCGLIGGVSNIVTSSTVGIVCGFVGCGIATLQAPRQFVIAGFRRSFLPIFGFALLTGALAAVLTLNAGINSESGDLLTTLLPMLFGLVVTILVLWRIDGQRKFYTWPCAILIFTVVSSIGFLWALDYGLYRRDSTMKTVDTYQSHIDWFSRNMTTQWARIATSMGEQVLAKFYRSDIHFRKGSGSADIEHAEDFPWISAIAIEEGSTITDEDLARLDTRYLRSLNCASGTRITSKGIKDIDKSRLNWLTLSGPNFSDEALQGLSEATWLWNVSLAGTNMTSSAVKQLNPTASIYELNLSNTQVDDDAFETLGQMLQLRSLILRGTSVTGRNLKALRGMSLMTLDLSDTQFEEQHLRDLLAPEGERPKPINVVTLHGLHLANVPLSESSFEIISQLKHLRRLDVSGSKINRTALAYINSIPNLSSLVLDGEGLDSADIEVMRPSIDLTIAFDGAGTPTGKIMTKVKTLIGSRNSSKNSAVIRNLKLTTKQRIRDFLQATGEFPRFDIGLANVELPDGSIRDIGYLSQLELLLD